MLKISYFLTQVENDFFFPDKTQQIFPISVQTITVENVGIIYDYLEDQRLLGPTRKFFFKWNFQGWHKKTIINAFLKNCLNILKTRHSDTKNLKNKIP